MPLRAWQVNICFTKAMDKRYLRLLSQRSGGGGLLGSDATAGLLLSNNHTQLSSEAVRKHPEVASLFTTFQLLTEVRC